MNPEHHSPSPHDRESFEDKLLMVQTRIAALSRMAIDDLSRYEEAFKCSMDESKTPSETLQRSMSSFSAWLVETGWELRSTSNDEEFFQLVAEQVAMTLPEQGPERQKFVDHAIFFITFSGLSSTETPVPLSEASFINHDPELNALERAVRAAIQSNYFEAKANKGFKTAQEVANASGVSLGTIYAIERHAIKPRRRNLEKLAKALGLSGPEAFYEGKENFL